MALRRSPLNKNNLAPEKSPVPKRRTRPSQKWKTQEREISRHMQQADGPPKNPALKLLQTVTGRLGHLYSLRMDSASEHYTIEVKNRKLPAWVCEAWALLYKNGRDYNLEPLLVLTLTKGQDKGDYEGSPVPLSPLYCITQTRHDELLRKEREYDALTQNALTTTQEKYGFHATLDSTPEPSVSGPLRTKRSNR